VAREVTRKRVLEKAAHPGLSPRVEPADPHELGQKRLGEARGRDFLFDVSRAATTPEDASPARSLVLIYYPCKSISSHDICS